LAEDYAGNLVPMQYRCRRCGYVGEKCLNDARKSGCRECGKVAGAKKRQKSEGEIFNIAEKAGVVMLEMPHNSEERVRVRFIKCGHEQRKSIAALDSGKARCSICTRKQPITPDDYAAFAAKHNIEIVRIGRNANTPSIWKCPLGHKFPRSWTNMQSTLGYCPKCSGSRSELLTQAVVEKLFSKTFMSIRLKSAVGKGGRPLQLDMYNHELRLAIEHHGAQHFRPIDYFGGSKVFETQQLHDQRKRDACANERITLIEVAQLGERTSIEELREQIGRECITAGIALPPDFWRSDLSNFRVATASEIYWKRALASAAEQGFRPTSLTFVSAVANHGWICERNHKFERSAHEILRAKRKMCPYCFEEKRCCPVLLGDGRVFASEALAAKSLGVRRTSVNRAVRNDGTVAGLSARRITLAEYSNIKSELGKRSPDCF
jgi:hypothetical protein